VSNGKIFFQKLFEDGPISSIIPQHPRSRTRIMMKQKGKTPIEKQVEKHVKKKPVSKAKVSQKMLQWMKMDPMNSNGLDELVLKAYSTCSGKCKKILIMKLPTNVASNERWKNFRASMWSRNH
jgi:hypothetical protein